jgi:hypothetical protein
MDSLRVTHPHISWIDYGNLFCIIAENKYMWSSVFAREQAMYMYRGIRDGRIHDASFTIHDVTLKTFDFINNEIPNQEL